MRVEGKCIRNYTRSGTDICIWSIFIISNWWMQRDSPQCSLLLPILFFPLNGLCSLLIIYKMIAIPHPWLLDSWEICRKNQQCQCCASATSLSLLNSLVSNLLIPKATGSVLCHCFHKASLMAALCVKYWAYYEFLDLWLMFAAKAMSSKLGTK